MTLTDPERRALRARCAHVVPGFTRTSIAEDFARLATWCAAHGIEHDVYGEGALVGDFEARVATLLGKEAAVFMPSGIMSQLAAIRIWTERAAVARFGMHPTSHLLSHEDEAYAALLGLHGVPIGDRLRPMTATDLDAVPQPLGCVIVELPIREAGGQLPDWDALEALKLAARRRDLPLHMDGARLWECAAYYGRSHAEIADGFASVYVSLYKGIGGFAGSMLVGEGDFIAEARLWRRRMGGTLFHLSPLVAAAAMRFDERLALMPALYERTLRFADALRSIGGIRLAPATPHTNLLHLHFDADADAILDARDRIAESSATWLLDRARPGETPGWCVTELYIGDALLSIDDANLAPLFARLCAEARGR